MDLGTKINIPSTIQTCITQETYFSEQQRVFLTRCNAEISGSNIIYFEGAEEQEYNDIKPISTGGFFNTQPFVANHKTQRALYFVSDEVDMEG